MDANALYFRANFRAYADLFAPRVVRRMLEVTSPERVESLLALPHVAVLGEERCLCADLVQALAGRPTRRDSGPHADLRMLDAQSALAALTTLREQCRFPHFRHTYHVVTLLLPPTVSPALARRIRGLAETAFARLFVAGPANAPRETFAGFLEVRGVVPNEETVATALARLAAERGLRADASALRRLAASSDRCVYAGILRLNAASQPAPEPLRELCDDIQDGRPWDIDRITSFTARAASRGVTVAHLALSLLSRARAGAGAGDPPPSALIALAAGIDAQTARIAQAGMRNVHHHMEVFVATVVGFGVETQARPRIRTRRPPAS